MPEAEAPWADATYPRRRETSTLAVADTDTRGGASPCPSCAARASETSASGPRKGRASASREYPANDAPRVAGATRVDKSCSNTWRFAYNATVGLLTRSALPYVHTKELINLGEILQLLADVQVATTALRLGVALAPLWPSAAKGRRWTPRSYQGGCS